MANLRADNLTGTGGRNAIDGSVYFSGYIDGKTEDHLIVPDSDDLDVGTGDFTFEAWVKPVEHNGTNSPNFMAVFSAWSYHVDMMQVQIKNDGKLRCNNNGTIDQTGTTVLWGNWHHIAFARSGSTIKGFVDGVEEISFSYSSAIDFAYGGNAVVGASAFGNYPGDYPYKGLISNLRFVKGTAVYTASFTPPTTNLTAIDGTSLLCCHDMDDPTAEATGKELVGFRRCYHGKRYSNIATNGDLETGDTTGWTNGGCSTFEVSTDVVHSGTYSLHCISDGNGDHVYTTVSVRQNLRYKISAYINCTGPAGTSAKAKMKIGTSAAANTNYESQTADMGTGWQYVEWIGLLSANTTYITFNESSGNDANEWYVDDLRVELWYPEEGENILPHPNFLTGATGWSFSSTPSGEYTISSNRLNVTDTSRTNDAFATVQLFSGSMAEGVYKVTIDYVLTADDFDIGIGNNRIFGVAGGGTYSGEGNSASVTYEFEAGSGNSSLRLIANQHCVGYFNSITCSRVAEPKRINELPPVGIDEGVTFEGETKVNTQSYMYFPTGDTSQRGRGRAVFAGGYTGPSPGNGTTGISYFQIQSQGTAIDFGSLTEDRKFSAGLASGTRGVHGGSDGTPGWATGTMEYLTIATTSNTTSFGNMTQVGGMVSAHSNNTRGLFFSVWDANTSGSSHKKHIDYITIATAGNAADFGELTAARPEATGFGSPTRGICSGGYAALSPNAALNTIDYLTIATTGDATDFG